jgi:hypothetical protein
MLQINPFLDCTLYSGIVVHIGRNNQLVLNYEKTIHASRQSYYHKNNCSP